MRVAAFMKELDEELWKLGVTAKTEHNEAAPAQHELAPIFCTSNIAVDHNQITMEMMRKVAKRHDLTCLLHEKPFAGVNGSGKHNNWSLCTNDGVNLLEPGATPEDNAQFLLVICAVLKAVDEYQDLLRISVASCANDCRLGGNEAPPAILSVYLGDELEAILDSIEYDKPYDKVEASKLTIGVDALPSFPRDTTDRNRTSPFAFTGNKFEFRMPGSSMSAAGSTTIINTAVAESFRQFADELEKAENFTEELNELIRRTIKDHKRIIFNGNGYDEAWVVEAEKRGLSNYPSTADCLPHLTDEKNIELFVRHGVYSETEIFARRDILLESYCKEVNIEAQVMTEMARRDIIPTVINYEKQIADAINSVRRVSVTLNCRTELSLLERITDLTEQITTRCDSLQETADRALNWDDDLVSRVFFYRDEVLPHMADLREAVDHLEGLCSKENWPYPSYGTLLYRV